MADFTGDEIKRQLDRSLKTFEKNVQETVTNYNKAIKPLSESINKTNKDFDESKVKIEKNLKDFGVNTEKFFRMIAKEAKKTGKSTADILNQHFKDREEYLTDELSLLKAREKKMSLSWRGEKGITKRLKGIIREQLTAYKEKSPLLSTLSSIKDFVVGNKNAMLENEKEVLANNQDILAITRKRQKEDEDNQKNIKAAYLAKKEGEERIRALDTKYRQWLIENENTYIDEREKAKRKSELWHDIEMDNRYKKMAEVRWETESPKTKSDIKKTTGKMPEDLKVQVSNNKLMKKMVGSLSKMEDRGGSGLGGLLKLLAPLLMGGLAFAGMWKLLGSKNAIANALSSLRMLLKLDKIKTMVKGLDVVGTLFKGMGKLGGVIGKIGGGLGLLGKGAGKIVGKVAGKLGLNVLKKIPGIGLLISIGLASKSFKDGDYIQGLMELASGGLATFAPGIGTALSIAIDMATMYADYKDINMTDSAANMIEDIKNPSKATGRKTAPRKWSATTPDRRETPQEQEQRMLRKQEASKNWPKVSQKVVPMAVGQQSFVKLKENEKKQEEILADLFRFLKGDFTTGLAKKTAEMNKKGAEKFNGPMSTGYSAFNWGMGN